MRLLIFDHQDNPWLFWCPVERRYCVRFYKARGTATMKKLLALIAFIFIVGALAGPDKSNPNPNSHSTTKSYSANSSQASSFMDDVHSKVISDAEREYQMASSSGGNVDRCVQAGMVAAAYLQAHNQPSYQSWKMREEMDCHR
jgi:hypothetical protein